MTSEANIKHSQLSVINRYAKHRSRGEIMCKEDNVRKIINSTSIIKFKESKERVKGDLMQCRHEDLDKVLFKFFTLESDFSEFEDITKSFIVIGGNHRKCTFSMLIIIHIKVYSSLETIIFYEVVGDICIPEDKIEVLRTLASIIRKSFSNFNIFYSTVNVCTSIKTRRELEKNYFSII